MELEDMTIRHRLQATLTRMGAKAGSIMANLNLLHPLILPRVRRHPTRKEVEGRKEEDVDKFVSIIKHHKLGYQ